MRRVRLRWRLAFSHALLAVVLVAVAGNRIEAQSRVAERARAVAIAERDADVLAARASRVFDRKSLLDDLVEDEQRGSRRAEVVSTDFSVTEGSQLSRSNAGVKAAASVIRDGAPATAVESDRVAFAASPIVDGSVLVGVAIVSDAVPAGVPGIASFGVSNWLGALIVVVAAISGWFLASLLTRPIAAFTDDVRGQALGTVDSPKARWAMPEVATLSAAIQGIAGRRSRREDLDTERRQSLRSMAHRLSHQLRTPLAILRLRVDDLADPTMTESRRAVLVAVVADQIERLDALGAELSVLDPARWELQREQVDLTDLVRQVVDRDVPLAEWGGVAMTMIASHPRRGGQSSGTHVFVDVGLVDDAISNVIHNAIKYTSRGGRITVTVDATPAEVQITVDDTGPGIRPNERDHVLRAAVRGSASSASEGTGYGLGLVADAMTRHGGRVELGDSPSGGASVRMVIPRRVAEPGAHDHYPRSQ